MNGTVYNYSVKWMVDSYGIKLMVYSIQLYTVNGIECTLYSFDVYEIGIIDTWFSHVTD